MESEYRFSSLRLNISLKQNHRVGYKGLVLMVSAKEQENGGELSNFHIIRNQCSENKHGNVHVRCQYQDFFISSISLYF